MKLHVHCPVQVHSYRKVAEDIWAIRERYFESSINYANLYFFQVEYYCPFSNVSFKIFSLNQGTAADLLLDTGVGIHEVCICCFYFLHSKLTLFRIFLLHSKLPPFRNFSILFSQQLPPFLSSAGLRPNEEKPMSVLITHMHFDHSGGGHQFQEV